MDNSARLSLVLAIVPVIFLLKFIYAHDKEREPKKYFLKSSLRVF